ncbi:tRNA 2-thiocytidine biosynthesis TtcA family protein [Pseudoramibacter faecis]|uniref:tRNA 2-thiocytidine biosynthesis TtcA family protein n=1 Tax=Pseudoramibacter faecis TaxID=3108534 RepID=UPI002E7845CB|nr:ATP-binding protein [Pseudoramibacter sp. HA2172]
MQKILSPMRRAIQQFDMISPGDRIAIGISGGKDSMALLAAMARYQKFSPIPFELEAITLDAGLEGMDFSPIADYCRHINVPYTIKKSAITKVVFDIRQEKNPCALCARMRRGALHNLSKELGCNKIALGHHSDDVVETFFLSLLYESRINTFMPVAYLDRKQITLIRPLVFVKEKDIIFDKTCQRLPLIKSTCPADGHTKRQTVKNMLEQLKKEIPDLNPRIISAIQNKNQMRLWF